MSTVTRLNDRNEPVPDAIWNEAVRHDDEQALAAGSWSRVAAVTDAG